MVLEKRRRVKHGGRVEQADWTGLAGTGGQWVQAGAFLCSATVSPLLCNVHCALPASAQGLFYLLSYPLLLGLLCSIIVSANGFNSSSAWWPVGPSRCFSSPRPVFALPSQYLKLTKRFSLIKPLNSRTPCITFKFQHQMNKKTIHCQ